MEAFSALLAICAWNSTVTGEFSAQRPVTRSVWIYGWVNNGEADDLRRNPAHDDVTVMIEVFFGGNHSSGPYNAYIHWWRKRYVNIS